MVGRPRRLAAAVVPILVPAAAVWLLAVAVQSRTTLLDGQTFFRPVRELAQSQIGDRRKIDIFIGGEASPTHSSGPFPASFYTFPRCSATLVGNRVLITAGHCIEPGEHVGFKLLDGTAHVAECDQYLEGPWNGWTVDLALCFVLDKAVEGVTFETLASADETTGVDADILLTGFGPNPSHPPRTFLIGNAKVSAITGTHVVATGAAWTTPGDSGGGIYGEFSSSRRLIGINSVVDAGSHTSTGISLNALRDLISQWKEAKALETGEPVWICGHDNNSYCRP